jgi:hypothetical protein
MKKGRSIPIGLDQFVHHVVADIYCGNAAGVSDSVRI